MGSNISEIDPSAIRIESALAMQPPATGEPVIAQVDNAQIQSIYDACTNYKYLKDDHGQIIRVEDDEKGDKYPRIKRLLSMLGPLEGNTRYRPEEARIAWFNSKHRIRRLKAYHRNDDYAKEILDEIADLRYRVIMGDAFQGHKQTHVQKVSGAERKITLEREGRRGSFIGGLFKR